MHLISIIGGKNLSEAPKIIKELVEQFDRNIDAYKSSGYKEEQLKQEFLNKFFKALGWDVDNEKGAAPQYRDVIFEDSIKIGEGTNAPDYCFTLSGKRIFFVEAKKPSVDIKRDIHPAYQLRRYAWSAKLPLSILTDFEEFAVYESRVKPKKEDKASVERIMYLTYKDYVEKWDEIADIFSHRAIVQGSFDKYIESVKKKRGTQEVDDEFLTEIESWREMLAKNIALRNSELSVNDLNFAVQRSIDRIIFLRMCEDRGIERYGQLQNLIEGKNIYSQLCEIYKNADDKYNSGLFHFKQERGRTTLPDKLTLKIIIDDKVLSSIIKNLYYPDSPYEFSVLSPEILGNVYERFLGKVIRLTAGHRAKIEDKPEVIKAGGVYYTPQYIVDYIVENTIGKLCKGRTPKQITKLRILDPACGSGSFLLGAYTYLLDYHLKYYTHQKNPKRLKDQIYPIREKEYLLTVQEKKRILLNNIYGVDIDPQAVEVTKLSLLLKVLEGERKDIFEQQQKLWRERVLPDLGNNIKCGNSLIGPDFYDNIQTKLIEDEEIFKINAFDWDKEFKNIMEDGGFDAVIGNPPWGADFSDNELDYLRKMNQRIIIRMIDSYMYFIYQAIKLLNKNRSFGMIIPSTLLTQVDMKLLRQFLIEKTDLSTVINLGDKVFGPKVLNTSTILILDKNEIKKKGQIIVADLRNYLPEEKPQLMKKISPISFTKWSKLVLSDPDKTFFTLNLPGVALFQKISKRFSTFQTILDGKIQRGISPDYAEAFIVNNKTIKEEKIEKNILHSVVLGKYIFRYGLIESTDYIIYLTKDININSYPYTKAHLSKYRDKINCREVKEGKHPWFSLHRPRNPIIFKPPKFIGLTTTKKICVALDESMGYYATDALYLFKINESHSLQRYYVLGILHSKCFQFLYQILTQGEQRVIPQIKAIKLYDLPFPVIDKSQSVNKNNHDKMVKLVIQIFNLNKKKLKVKNPFEKERLQRQIDSTDHQIDQLVYELYGLTKKEIKIIEDAIK